MKKIIPIVFLSLIFLSLTVSAMSPDTYSKMGFFSQMKYSLFNGGLFTTWGQVNCCSIQPDTETWINYGQTVTCSSKCSTNKCAIDVWWSNYYSSQSKPTSDPNWNNFWGEVTSGSYTPGATGWYYYQIYCCPTTCGADTSHSTQTYKCVNNVWTNTGTVTSSDTTRWCSNTGQNNYMDNTGNVHCASSASSAWCPTACTPNWQLGSWGTCTSGTQTRTVTDSNNCGVTTNKPVTSQSCTSGGTGGTETTCGSIQGACGLTCATNVNDVLGGLGDYGCNVLQVCCIPKCAVGTTRCSDNTCKSDCSGIYTNQTTGQLLCKNNEEVFYTNANVKTTNKIWAIIPITSSSSSSDVINANKVNEIIPGFSNKYFESIGQACCDGNSPIFLDSKVFQTSSWALIGIGTSATANYDQYKCSSTETQGFCFQTAQNLLGNITKSDCQTSTIVLIIIIILSLIVISRFMG